MSRNLDDDIPIGLDTDPILISDNLKIFWGPDQRIGELTSRPDAWRANEVLNIPQVNRLIWATDGDGYNTDGYSDDDGDPTPDPQNCTNFEYEIQNVAYILNMGKTYYDPDDDGFYNFSVEVTAGTNVFRFEGIQTDEYPQATFEACMIKFYREPGHVLLYTGSVWAAPYWSKIPSRYVAWFQRCIWDGCDPQPCPRTFLTNNRFTLPTGEDPNQPPRCWSPLLRIDEATGAAVPNVGYSPNEVPNLNDPGGDSYGLREWYGCSSVPPP